MNGPDRARVGCFAGCARIPSHFRSRICSDSRSIDAYSSASDEDRDAFLRIYGAVRPILGMKRIGQSRGGVLKDLPPHLEACGEGPPLGQQYAPSASCRGRKTVVVPRSELDFKATGGSALHSAGPELIILDAVVIFTELSLGI